MKKGRSLRDRPFFFASLNTSKLSETILFIRPETTRLETIFDF